MNGYLLRCYARYIPYKSLGSFLIPLSGLRGSNFVAPRGCLIVVLLVSVFPTFILYAKPSTLPCLAGWRGRQGGIGPKPFVSPATIKSTTNWHEISHTQQQNTSQPANHPSSIVVFTSHAATASKRKPIYWLFLCLARLSP